MYSYTRVKIDIQNLKRKFISNNYHDGTALATMYSIQAKIIMPATTPVTILEFTAMFTCLCLSVLECEA